MKKMIPEEYTAQEEQRLAVKDTKHRREYRELSDETKQRISVTAKGRPKSAEHRQHISQAMYKYWRGVPHRPSDDESQE